ncbi:Zinc finger MYM-type protein 6 [Thelohanellus kitauei]|uniref:Zinc finger MYM-type protein 6 n=1 Tax=Thelohanellus kitauei TaxID=669202 RepID=A0A0C2NC64_THEKT|nr:Zinc finger MYM-type protein 6 [Thelohanellus kitauei]
MKRKGEDFFCGEFKSDLTDKFMFALNSYGKPVCLIFGFCVSHAKRYHLARDLTKKHSEVNVKYPIIRINAKNGALDTQKSFLTNATKQSKSTCFALYEIAFLLARKKKPITDAEELIKPTLIITARMLGYINCKKIFNQIPLLNNMMTRRVVKLASDIDCQLQDHIKKCTFFSMAIDESNDISDTAQVAVFVRAIEDN